MKIEELFWILMDRPMAKKRKVAKQVAGKCLHCNDKAVKLGCCEHHYGSLHYHKLRKIPKRMRSIFIAEQIANGVILESRQGQGGGPKRKVNP